MFQVIGIALLFALVFGSFVVSGGSLRVLLQAAPTELLAIGGAALGAYLISNSTSVVGRNPALSRIPTGIVT